MAAASSMTWAVSSPSAWDDDEDDIYYSESKADRQKREEQKKAREAAAAAAAANAASGYYRVPERATNYPDPSLYVPEGAGLNMDVDAYNRRGQFLVADSVSADSLQGADTYAYTRRLERFYDSDIVNASGDDDLIDSYYSTQSQPDINVYVVNPSPWSYGAWYNPWYYNPWYGPSWSMSWGWADPWYGPSWSWCWGWGPAWGPAWSWGPGWYPGWGPSWGPAWGPSWGPSWGGGHWATTTPGAARPHPSTRPSTTTRRPGAISAGAGSVARRPGNLSTTRPGSTMTPSQIHRPGYQPAVGGSQSRPSGGNQSINMNRGRNNYNNSGYNNNRNSSTRRDNNSWSSPGSSRGNSGSWGGGSHSGGGSRSGGGSTRGRR